MEQHEKRDVCVRKIKEQESALLKQFNENRKDWKQKVETFKNEREEYRGKIFTRTEKVNKLKEVLAQENIDIVQLNDAIKEAEMNFGWGIKEKLI